MSDYDIYALCVFHNGKVVDIETIDTSYGCARGVKISGLELSMSLRKEIEDNPKLLINKIDLNQGIFVSNILATIDPKIYDRNSYLKLSIKKIHENYNSGKSIFSDFNLSDISSRNYVDLNYREAKKKIPWVVIVKNKDFLKRVRVEVKSNTSFEASIEAISLITKISPEIDKKDIFTQSVSCILNNNSYEYKNRL